MKNIILSIFMISFSFINSQNIYEYEKEISNKEKYTFKEIEFENTEEKIKLSGTLITPKTNFDKIIIIIPGSGKDTRHSHFRLAEEFLKNGIAVYRYDERGIGKSEGNYNADASSLTNDLFFAINSLKNRVDYKLKKIGLLGHSLGGMASIGAYRKGAKIDFLIQMSTPVKKNGDALIYQLKIGNKGINQLIKGENFERKIELIKLIHLTIVDNPDVNTQIIFKKINKIARKKGFKQKSYKSYIMPYLVDIIKKDYEKVYKNINISTLYIVGSKDEFLDSKNEIKLLKSYNNKNIEIQLMNGYSHYLTTSELKKMDTSIYDMNENALSRIINWTLKN